MVKATYFIGRGRHKMIIRQCNLPCPQLYITFIVQPFPSPPSPSTGNSPLGQHGLIVNSFTVSDDLSVNKHGFVYHIAVQTLQFERNFRLASGERNHPKGNFDKKAGFLLPETGDDSVTEDNLTCHSFISMINLVYRKTNRCVYRPHI